MNHLLILLVIASFGLISAASDQIFSTTGIPWGTPRGTPLVLNFTTIPAYPNELVKLNLQYPCCGLSKFFRIKMNAYTDGTGLLSFQLDNTFALRNYFYIVSARFKNVENEPTFTKWFTQH